MDQLNEGPKFYKSSVNFMVKAPNSNISRSYSAVQPKNDISNAKLKSCLKEDPSASYQPLVKSLKSLAISNRFNYNIREKRCESNLTPRIALGQTVLEPHLKTSIRAMHSL
jgi:hypothetical protein